AARHRRDDERALPCRDGWPRNTQADHSDQRLLRARYRGGQRGEGHALRAGAPRRRAGARLGGSADHLQLAGTLIMWRILPGPALLTAGALLSFSCTPGAQPQQDTTADGTANGSADGSAGGSRAGDESAGRVVPGLEVLLADSSHLVRGRRVGFLTNQTAVTSQGESGIDLLHESSLVQLAALYGPEHGLRGGVEGGVKIEGGI